MKFPMDMLVRTEGNKRAIEAIEQITQVHDKPIRIFLVGPEESGKTEVLRSRELDRDLLSTKRVLYRPCSELPEALQAGVYDGYLEDLGNTDVLFLDDFEGFFENEEIGPYMCMLLLRERDRLGLDTVVSSRLPLSSFDLKEMGSVFDDFEEIYIKRLEGEEMVDYVKMLIDLYFEEGHSPVLSEEAIRYIAFDLGESMEMMRKAMHYLLVQYVGEPGEVLSREFVVEALRKQ